VRQVARDHDHLAGAHGVGLLAAFAEVELQRPLEDVRDLLVVVAVAGHLGALGEVDVREHHLVAGDQAPPEPVLEVLGGHVVPAVRRQLGHGRPLSRSGSRSQARAT